MKKSKTSKFLYRGWGGGKIGLEGKVDLEGKIGLEEKVDLEGDLHSFEKRSFFSYIFGII